MPKQICEYYIKATGATCYDETGITWPVQEVVDWGHILRFCRPSCMHMEHIYGHENCPEVLVFQASPYEIKLVDEELDANPETHFRVITRVKDW